MVGEGAISSCIKLPCSVLLLTNEMFSPFQGTLEWRILVEQAKSEGHVPIALYNINSAAL